MTECKKIKCPTCNNEVEETFVEQQCPRCQTLIESKFICGSCHNCADEIAVHTSEANSKGLINKIFSLFQRS